MDAARGGGRFAASSDARSQRRRALRLSLSAALGLVLTGLVMTGVLSGQVRAGPRSAPAGTTRCVNPGGTGGCYGKIQDAIDASSFGDVITVATGIYTEHIVMRDGTSIYGHGWDTIINGNYSGPTSTVDIPWTVSASTVLSGVQITGGGTGDPNTSFSGGGIRIAGASPSIVNTFVNSCTGYYGGGVYVGGGAPTFNNVPVWSSRALYGGGFYLTNNANVTMLGNPFEGTNGTIWWNSASGEGGGIYISGVTATLAGLRLYWNAATYGGGVSIENTPNQVTLVANDISGNQASSMGGGIATANATHLGVFFNSIGDWVFLVWGNTAASGGGGASFSQSAGLVQLNWFIGNRAPGYNGGGVNVVAGSAGLTLSSNWFEGNSAGCGGGLEVSAGASPLVDANTFVSNTATSGGGIRLHQTGPVTVTNNILARNTSGISLAGGICVERSPGRIVNNTIADNTGDGVQFREAEGVAIVNNIVSGNLGRGIEHYSDTWWVSPTLVYTADYNDLYMNTANYGGLLPGIHDLSVNSLFVGAGPDLKAYYHITTTSPVSTTGSVAWAPVYDIDGDWRLAGGSVSMGVDEMPGAVYHLYLPLVTKN